MFHPKYLILALLFVLGLANLFYYLPRVNDYDEIRRTDFASYYVGGLIFRENIKKLYDFDTQKNKYTEVTGVDIQKYNELTDYKYADLIKNAGLDTYFLPYRNTPIVAGFVSLFVGFGYSVAYYAFIVFNLVLTVFSCYLLMQSVVPAFKVFVPLLLFAYKPFYIALFQGQPTVIVFFILSAYLFYLLREDHGLQSVDESLKARMSSNAKSTLLPSLKRIKGGPTDFGPWGIHSAKKRDSILGMLTSLILLKLQYLTILPFLFLLVRNKKKYLVASFISIMSYILLNTALYGRYFFADYLHFLKLTENFKYFSSPNYMLSVQAWLVQIFNIDNFSFYILLFSGLLYVLFLASIFLLRNRVYNIGIFFGIGIMCGLLFSLHFLTQDLLLFFIYFIFVSDWLYQNSSSVLFSKISLVFLISNLSLFLLASVDTMSYVIFNSSIITSSTLLLSLLVICVLYPLLCYKGKSISD